MTTPASLRLETINNSYFTLLDNTKQAGHTGPHQQVNLGYIKTNYMQTLLTYVSNLVDELLKNSKMPVKSS